MVLSTRHLKHQSALIKAQLKAPPAGLLPTWTTRRSSPGIWWTMWLPLREAAQINEHLASKNNNNSLTSQERKQLSQCDGGMDEGVSS